MPQFIKSMHTETQISINPEFLDNETEILRCISLQIGVESNRIKHFSLRKRSVDARKRNQVVYQLRYDVWVDEEPTTQDVFELPQQNVSHKKEIYIVGLGPAGLFAALKCIELGYKPVVLERGKAVRERRRDLAALNKEGIVNPESNYCFGEGGAGTFSDGKLYTRSTKRGDTASVLNILHYFGATADITIDAHPHIGTNKLPQIIQNMREKIIECGGEVRFDTKLTNVFVQDNQLSHIEVNGNEKIATDSLILATGHSARDIFELLHHNKIAIEAKSFAIGVRVEHPQGLIDSLQYHCDVRHPNLPAASYSLVKQILNKGVYSFCMCPGGIICPAATEENGLVVNGWSPSKRDSPFANSGMVVEVAMEDFMSKNPSPLDGILFQRKIEEKAFIGGGGKQVAPALRLGDFVAGKVSTTLPDCSYLPGLQATDLRNVLPTFVHKRLQEGFRQFGQMMKGYVSNEAVVVGVESRTSSPVRIPRAVETFMHPQVKGLFPCGEGAGYAGGIMSAAIDGQKCAAAAVRFLVG